MLKLVMAKDCFLVVKLEKLFGGFLVADAAVELPKDPSRHICLPVSFFEEVRPPHNLLFNLCDTFRVNWFAVLGKIYSD